MWETNIDWLPPVYALTGDWTYNLDMCPDWYSNLQHFGAEEDAPANWVTCPGKKNPWILLPFLLVGNWLIEDVFSAIKIFSPETGMVKKNDIGLKNKNSDFNFVALSKS